MIRKVVIIGSGNVAEALALAIAANPELELVQLFARNSERGRHVAALATTTWSNDPACLAEADIYLLAVSDRAVSEVATTLPFPPTAIVAHTAGCVSIEALGEHPRRAICYPFQGFSVGRRINFREVPLFLETADPELMPSLEAFARSLSARVYRADSAQRARIHLAGVFCCNFTNCMYTLAEEQLQQAGLPFDVLRPLIAETAAKAIEADHPAEVQTGPARRGDAATLERHRTMLTEEHLRTMYNLISQTIWETSKKI